MVTPRVLFTTAYPYPASEILSPYCEIEVNHRGALLTKGELTEMIGDKDAVICMVADKFDREVIAAGEKLRVVSSYSVGLDHIDLAEATERGIYVTYTPGVLTEATADFAWVLLMAAARRVAEADRLMRRREWKVSWTPTFMLGFDLCGATLGIVGLGRIGTAIARRAKGFNMKVIYYDVVRADSTREKELGVEYADVERLFSESDFVTIHAPYTPETHHLVDEFKLRLMKPTAVLVNTSRGGVVDQKAVVKALREKWIAAAGLDVYEKEPVDDDDSLLELENVVLAPHLGSATVGARRRMAETAAKNLLAVLKGEEPLHLANPEAMKKNPLSSVKMI